MSGTKGDKTVLRSLSLGGLYGGTAQGMVDVKDGKILRVRPFRFDWKWDRSEVRTWKIEKNGITLEPRWKSLIGAFSAGYKKRVYSPNRIKYPLIRVDWDPNGERNTHNRGKSKYRRASWDEVTTIIASEIRRIHAKYGVNAILQQGEGHGESKLLNTPHGQPGILLKAMGGFTQQVRNPDSWEGWYWGSKHVWGQGIQGMMLPAGNTVKDCTDHSDMMLFWSCDPETTPWGFTGQFPSRLSFYWTAIGMKQIYICPEVNYGAAVHADKWIPVLPNTDAALQLAIAYVWIKEGTYKKDYVATHVVGMEQFSDYVLGKEDGIPKTPEWAAKKCGVPEYTIKALAREMARKIFSISHYFGGGMIRGPYSSEPARLECCLLGMQGLGGPGVHQLQISYFGMPRMEGLRSTMFWNPKLSDRLAIPIASTVYSWQNSLLPKTYLNDHLRDPDGKPLEFFGAGAIEAPVSDQFVHYQFPIAETEGSTKPDQKSSKIRMIWSDTPCRTTCWNHGHEAQDLYGSEQLETIVIQHPWLENECILADILLPVNTFMEVDDMLTNVRQSGMLADVMIAEQAIKPIGESRSDFECVVAVAEKLGDGLVEKVTGGHNLEDMRKQVFNNMELDKLISYEEFRKRGYYVYNVAEDWEKDPAGFRQFFDDPEKYPLPTPTGKLEFYSDALAKAFPDDLERPPVPHWVECGITHPDERLGGERAKKYSLLVQSNHPRWRTHAQADDITWTREAPTCKIVGPDNYAYEPVWIHPSEAAKRGIKHGEIVKIFNEKGIVLVGAYVTERMRPGVAYVDHGARVDPIILGKVDRGGAINLISPIGVTSKNACGMASSGYLAEVAKVTPQEWDEWRRVAPEAFERVYDRGAGLRFDAWVVKDGGAK
jgi:anaerobic selenocysteine-containing dehydrogenase